MKWFKLSPLLFCLLLMACAARIYGLPKDAWQAMSPAERQLHMQQQQELALAREARAKAQAEARAEQAALERVQAEQALREQVTPTPTPAPTEPVPMVNSLRVTLEGGQISHQGAMTSYVPISFIIAENETREVELSLRQSLESRARMRFRFQDQALWVDLASYAGSGYRLQQQSDWVSGRGYLVNSQTPHRLQNVQLRVEYLPYNVNP